MFTRVIGESSASAAYQGSPAAPTPNQYAPAQVPELDHYGVRADAEYWGRFSVQIKAWNPSGRC